MKHLITLFLGITNISASTYTTADDDNALNVGKASFLEYKIAYELSRVIKLGPEDQPSSGDYNTVS